jgi:hypothetical protein
MRPPKTLDVCDVPGKVRGFCALTKGGTLWRPERVLTEGGRTTGKPTTGTLFHFDEHSFFQLNDDVTRALYRVEGYSYFVVIWFDNGTGERIF